MKRLAVVLLLAVLAAACTPAPTAAPIAPTEAAPATALPGKQPAGIPTGFGIVEVHMFSAGRGWAWAQDAGGNSRLLGTEDGGASWSDRSPGGTGVISQGAAFLDADHAWVPSQGASGSAGGLVRTADGGKTWSDAAAASGPYTLYEFQSEQEGIARNADVGAGNAHVRFYVTHDGGQSWSGVSITARSPEASPDGSVHICSICGDTVSLFPPAKVIITHGDLAGDPQGAVRLSVSMDLGNSWQELELPMPSAKFTGAGVEPEAPLFLDAQRGVMPVHIFKSEAGSTYPYQVLALYTTSDGGKTWSAGAAVAEDVPIYESAIEVLSPTDAIARCGNSLCATHDAGQSWTAIKPNIDLGEFGSEHQLTEIDFIDLNTGWAVVTDDDLHLLYRTEDGGATWTLLAKG